MKERRGAPLLGSAKSIYYSTFIELLLFYLFTMAIKFSVNLLPISIRTDSQTCLRLFAASISVFLLLSVFVTFAVVREQRPKNPSFVQLSPQKRTDT